MTGNAALCSVFRAVQLFVNPLHLFVNVLRSRIARDPFSHRGIRVTGAWIETAAAAVTEPSNLGGLVTQALRQSFAVARLLRFRHLARRRSYSKRLARSVLTSLSVNPSPDAGSIGPKDPSIKSSVRASAVVQRRPVTQLFGHLGAVRSTA